MTHAIRIVGPAGRETYLCDGSEIDSLDRASRYDYETAEQHADAYREQCAGLAVMVDVIDLREEA